MYHDIRICKMLRINHRSSTPIYQQIVDEVRRLIAIGELKPGDSLPPIRGLANQLDVAVNTVARAYQELDNLNIIEGNRRKGSFIKLDLQQIPSESRKVFKDPILILIQDGLSRKEIKAIFDDNLSQIFD
jgi:GntR family transcriptional regulator